MTRFVLVNDFVLDAEFEAYPTEQKHHARTTEHGAVWVAFTMGVSNANISLIFHRKEILSQEIYL